MSIGGLLRPTERSSARTRPLVVASAIAVAVVAVLAVTTQPARASGTGVVGFVTVDAPSDVAPIVDDSVRGAVRSRYVSIDVAELAAVLAGDDVTIELFDDVIVSFGGSGVMSAGEGGQATWSATTPDAVATLSFADDGVRGTISAGAATYSILPAQGTTHVVFEEGRNLPNDTEALTPPGTPATSSATSAEDGFDAAPAIGSDAPATSSDASAPVVRVLTIFDDFTRSYYGSDAQAVAEIAATIDEVNAAYARSGASVAMESASIEHVPYTSAFADGLGGSGQTDLNRVTSTTDGILDAVHARRDAVGADIVVLMTQLDVSGTCGVAWLPVQLGASFDPRYGFSVLDPRCARGNLTFAHETGHNLGAGHGPADPGYANGYINVPGGYRTIMAYNNDACPGHVCTRVAYYSSPTVLYNGQPTGSPTQDNARVLGELAPFVSQYRGAPVCPAASLSALASLTPARLLDSRVPGGATVDGQSAGIGVRGAGSVTEVDVVNRGCVPLDVSAVVLNVTVVQARAGGFATVFPCGESPPNASNLNFVAGQTVPNAVVAKVGVDGKVCVFAEVPIDLIVDVNGYVPPGSSVGSLTPARLLDSRVPGGATVDGQSAGIGVRGAGSVTEVQVTGRGNVPAGAAAVVLNVTVVQARAGGFATVFPCGESPPNASNLNFVAGQTVPNAVVAKVGVDGKVCVFAEVPIDLIVDVNGYVPPGSSVGSLTPARLLDSRVPGGATVDGQSAGIGVRGAGSVTEVQVTGRGNVPAGAAAVVLNVTVVQARAGGFATVFPCGESPPNASNLNFVAGQTVPNAVVAKVGVDGKVCVFAEVPIDLIVDVNGYVAA